MKLGLLLALSVAALVLNLSEGRIVSKCELRQKLQEVLPLPRKYGRYKDQILALVTCELERRSHLDSSLVTGNAVLPTAAARRTTQAAEGNQTATEQDIISTISSAPMTNSTDGSFRRKRWAPFNDFREKSDKRRGNKGRGHDESGDSDNSSEENHKKKKNSKKSHESSEEESHEMENQEANKPTASSGTTEMSNAVSGNARLKRDASSKEKGNKRQGDRGHGDKRRGKKERGHDESEGNENSREESHGMENQGANKPTASSSTTEMSNAVSGNARLKRDASSKEKGNRGRGNKGQADKKRGNNGRQNDKKENKPSKHSHESSSQEKDNVKPNQGPAIYFGLFQLSDSYFCDSGNGSSKNLCNKNCSAFVDDDITDDLECFASKGYWRWILDEVSSSCSNQQDTYFDECQ
uniref:lysozyme n=1 Tax=Oryzias latipes TaxID=8090 RepID=H2L7D6_ORYLA